MFLSDDSFLLKSIHKSSPSCLIETSLELVGRLRRSVWPNLKKVLYLKKLIFKVSVTFIFFFLVEPPRRSSRQPPSGRRKPGASDDDSENDENERVQVQALPLRAENEKGKKRSAGLFLLTQEGEPVAPTMRTPSSASTTSTNRTSTSSSSSSFLASSSTKSSSSVIPDELMSPQTYSRSLLTGVQQKFNHSCFF